MKNWFEFYKGKRVLVTGHTGFKGSWLCRILLLAGAKVCGYALEPPTKPSLYEFADIEDNIESVIGDIRDREKLMSVFSEFKPEIVIHMAAQPIVRESYVNPVYTYETNVMGTVNICECVRLTDSVRSFVNVTTDKVYDNKERENEGYREDEPLDGYDPYSNSKSCSELVTHSYKKSFFNNMNLAVSTARAGNVIGGGDFAKDRIIPDCVRAALAGREIVIRNPHSVRPYQHVLEPVCAYLKMAAAQYENKEYQGYYNVGPDDDCCVTTRELVDIFCRSWGEGIFYKIEGDNGPHEAGFLKLNCDKLKKTFNWQPKWSIETAIDKVVEFSRLLENLSDAGMSSSEGMERNSGNIINKDKIAQLTECMNRQIMEYMR